MHDVTRFKRKYTFYLEQQLNKTTFFCFKHKTVHIIFVLLKNYNQIQDFVFDHLKNNLASDLTYHGLHHTQDVLRYAEEIAEAEKISSHDLFLLKVAVLCHDTGFTDVYRGHEALGCEFAETHLPQFGINGADIDTILGMIRATIIPQQPTNLLECIIADADLLYLGTDRFEEIGETLFHEMKSYGNLKSRREWNEIQKQFLLKHHYHTAYCRTNYEKRKHENLKIVLRELES